MLGDSARGARPVAKDVSAAVPHLPDPTFPRPPPQPQPRPGLPGSARGAGSKVRHGRSPGGQGEAGTGPARAWPGVPGGLRGEGTRGVQGAPVACCWGRPPRRAARQGPGLWQPRGRGGATLSLRPPPSFPPARPAADFLSGKLRGSFPGLLAPPQVSAPSSSLRSRCSPAARRRRWQPGPGGGRGPRRRRLPTRPAM